MRSLGLALVSFLAGTTALADQSRSTLPDEIEAIGGEGAAQAHAGAASLSDQSAIHLNPAMLFKHRSYDVGGSYFWPSEGRPFYRLSVIDGVTSRWTAAAEYTGFQDALGERSTRDFDSPVRRRGSVAFAIPADRVALGFAGHYVEAEDPSLLDIKTMKGFTLGVGLVAQLASGLRAGISAENLNNKKLKDVSPQIFRAGLAYEPNGFMLFSADYRERKTSKYLEDQPLTESGAIALAGSASDPAGIDAESSNVQDSEKMAFLGAQVKTLDVLKLFLAAGRSLQGERKDRISGGIGIYQKNFSLAYALSRDYPDQKDLQGSLYLSIIMKM
jgi:hypothetical protein